ncbi:MAG: hypothetical protein QMC79_08140 [Anaerosomatales bacterium]|nr:hypothetical protein [Anaerosomatales bacterium]
MEAVLKKLRYAGQDPALVLDAPDELRSLIDAVAASGARVDTSAAGAYAWAIAFARDLDAARRIAATAPDLVEGDGIFWLVYPKKSSKRYTTDINRDTAWPLFDDTPLRFVANVAIDDDWSAIRLRRREHVG